jgi:hypothetical protein
VGDNTQQKSRKLEEKPVLFYSFSKASLTYYMWASLVKAFGFQQFTRKQEICVFIQKGKNSHKRVYLPCLRLWKKREFKKASLSDILVRVLIEKVLKGQIQVIQKAKYSLPPPLFNPKCFTKVLCITWNSLFQKVKFPGHIYSLEGKQQAVKHEHVFAQFLSWWQMTPFQDLNICFKNKLNTFDDSYM